VAFSGPRRPPPRLARRLCRNLSRLLAGGNRAIAVLGLRVWRSSSRTSRRDLTKYWYQGVAQPVSWGLTLTCRGLCLQAGSRGCRSRPSHGSGGRAGTGGVGSPRSGLSQRQLNDDLPLLPVIAGAHPGKRAAEQRALRPPAHRQARRQAGQTAGPSG